MKNSKKRIFIVSLILFLISSVLYLLFYFLANTTFAYIGFSLAIAGIIVMLYALASMKNEI